MSATILDGKELSKTIIYQIESMIVPDNVPGLAIIIIGSRPESLIYVNSKIKMCLKAGIRSSIHKLDIDVTEVELIAKIEELNQNDSINGILLQFPIPSHLSVARALRSINPDKDVDGFHIVNKGKLCSNDYSGLLPCTPLGIMEILKHYNIKILGKKVTILGCSDIVGKPLIHMFLFKGATVTSCHSKTIDIKEHTKTADIIVSAVGKPGLLTADMIKPGVVLIDVGINRMSNGKIVGDMDFEECKNIASYITPVPGGVGPMTVAMLLKNTMISVGYKFDNIDKYS